MLCFVDLVASLIISTLNIDLPERVGNTLEEYEDLLIGNAPSSRDTRTSMMDGTFQLYLYVSFPKRSEAIALDLFEALANHCNRLGKKYFDLHVRLSSEGKNPERWDEKFVQKELEKFSVDEINKIWVCGPPVMNETFDRAFHSNFSIMQ